MDKQTQNRILRKVLILFFIPAFFSLGGCRKDDGYKGYSSWNRQFKCDIPNDWVDKNTEKDAVSLAIYSPGVEKGVFSSLQVVPAEKRTREGLAEDMKWLRDNFGSSPFFSLEPLTSVAVGKFPGLMYSYTREKANLMSHQNGEAPPSLKYVETQVYFETPNGPYRIIFGAPLDEFKKSRTILDRFLKTFKWTGQGSVASPR
jgi:hypothetical protein